MPTGLTSYRSWDTAVTETVQVRVLGDKIVQLQPDVTPLIVMTTNAKKKKSTPVPRIERIEDDLRNLWDYQAGTTTLSSVATTLTVSTGSLFATNDLVAVIKPQSNASAPEIMRVTGIAANVLTVTRGVGGAGADSIYPTNALRIIGSAYAEGDTYGSFRSTQKVVPISYCQIFRTPVQLTRTMQASRTYGESDYQYQKAKALMEHKKEIEGSGLWSRASESLAAPNTIWTTMGFRSRVSTNVMDFQTTGTLTEFNTFSQTSFRYGSPAKLLIAAPVIISAINYYSQSKLLTEVGQTIFGVNIKRLTLPHGEYMLARNWLMEAGVSGQPGFATEMYSVDLNNVEFCYLADQGETRDTQYRENVVQTGVDAEQDEWSMAPSSRNAGEESLLIDSKAEMANEAEPETDRERLSEETPQVGDAIVRSHGNKNHERLAEMTNLCNIMYVADNKKDTQAGWIFTQEKVNVAPPHRNVGEEFSLIDLEGANPNRAELPFGPSKADRERLSERTPVSGDAIVWSHGNVNHESAAEMTAPCLMAGNNNDMRLGTTSLPMPRELTGIRFV